MPNQLFMATLQEGIFHLIFFSVISLIKVKKQTEKTFFFLLPSGVRLTIVLS